MVDSAVPKQTIGAYNLFWNNQPNGEGPISFDSPVVGDPRLTVMGDGPCNAAAWLPDLGGFAIDRGDPKRFDPDGFRSDIGASGGPEAHRDYDQDGFLDGQGEDRDCADLNPAVHPGAPEICNEIDDDCDDRLDDGDEDLVDAEFLYEDGDGDGYGVEPGLLRCGSDRYATVSGDCDDDNAEVFPGAPEVCNDKDDDCDEIVDLPICADMTPELEVSVFRGGGCVHTSIPAGSVGGLLLMLLLARRRA